MHPLPIEVKGQNRVAIWTRLWKRLARVPHSGVFIAEIDGLRFLAIAPVVVFHLRNYLAVHPVAAYSTPPEFDWLARVTIHGHFGVQLFFIISGFVLALPFAKHHLLGEGRVRLHQYYMRRLTRIEPPYLLVMVGCFSLFLLIRDESVAGLWTRFAASLTYLHWAIYSELNPINLVAWSLEVEVQFYLLMPLFATVFAVRRTAWRRALVMIAGAVCVLTQVLFIEEGSRLSWSLVNYLQYFLAGFLLADCYLSGMWGVPRRNFMWDVVSLVGWPLLVFVCERPVVARAAFAPLALMLFCAAFRGRLTNKAVTLRGVTVVGGMCYTIYLIHFQLLSAFEKAFGSVSLTSHFFLNLLLHLALFVPVLLTCSVIFFLLIEKPCMSPNWPHRLARRVRTVLRARAAGELTVRGRLAD